MELKYITQDNIDEAHINITSAEMYKEFQEYNGLMLRMQKKRYAFLRDFWALWIMNAILLFLGLKTFLFWNGSLIYMVSGMYPLCLLVAAVYLILMIYFIGVRKLYSWKAGLLISLLLIPVSLAFMPLVAANAIVIFLMEKKDSEMRNETGYPHFTQLHGSYKSMVKDGEVFGIESEGVYATGMKSENVVPEDPFAKYRIKPEDDMGMLADTDISDLRSNENG